MKRLAEMTAFELRAFMSGTARAFIDLLPPDGSFVLIVLDEQGLASFVADIDNEAAARVLRQVAEQIERQN
jgi:hypothetical protein